MGKWARRAKALFGEKAASMGQEAVLGEIVNQASTIVADIQFVMQSCGADDVGKIELNATGLDLVESFYRRFLRSEGFIEFGVKNFERLMAIMLGACIISIKGGEWTIYPGKTYVAHPVVVRLNSGRHADVFLMCDELWQKPMVGTDINEGRLSFFLNNVDIASQP